MANLAAPVQLCWFRTDLRVRDNQALASAIAAGPAVAIYIATPGQWQLHNDAPIKLDFWRRNLIKLKNELKQLRVELLLFTVADYANIPPLFDALLDCNTIGGIHYNREYPLNESRRDELVADRFLRRGAAATCYEDQTLIPAERLLNKSQKPFRVFTPFANKVRSEIELNALAPFAQHRPGCNSEPVVLNPAPTGNCAIADIPWPQSKSEWEQTWPAGEVAAHERLAGFVRHSVSTYKTSRDIPSASATSGLSPYIASGVLSIGACWNAAIECGENVGTETWQNELLWREFYRHIVMHFPHVCMHLPFRKNTDQIPWQHDSENFRKWCDGLTGFPLVDAGMRQLATTGWMHNRVRMVTAMFLSKHLLIDWRWGERWFMQNLIDGDFASNNGGWQWCASTGVDAVPYFRIFSPTRQSERFDSNGDYIRSYIPELASLSARLIHDPGASRPGNYPAPIIEHKFARERALNAFNISSAP